jgi:hypothetical protein
VGGSADATVFHLVDGDEIFITTTPGTVGNNNDPLDTPIYFSTSNPAYGNQDLICAILPGGDYCYLFCSADITGSNPPGSYFVGDENIWYIGYDGGSLHELAIVAV